MSASESAVPYPLRAAGIAGILAIVLQIVAIAALDGVPSPYSPADLAAWHGGLTAHADAAVVSAWTFTVGLVLLAVFALAWPELPGVRRPGLARLGARLFAFGALLDAAGTPAVAAVARFLPATDPANGPAARALLALTLELDATFNGLLGAGLLCVAVASGPALPTWLRVLGAVAGLASLPVALQAEDARFAALLAVSGPRWLVWCGAVAVRMVRGR
jgi:hypothetical protein